MKLGSETVAIITGAASGIGRAIPSELFSLPSKAAYAASRHAARAITEALGAELHGSGVTVTAVYPGATATALLQKGYGNKRAS